MNTRGIIARASGRPAAADDLSDAGRGWPYHRVIIIRQPIKIAAALALKTSISANYMHFRAVRAGPRARSSPLRVLGSLSQVFPRGAARAGKIGGGEGPATCRPHGLDISRYTLPDGGCLLSSWSLRVPYRRARFAEDDEPLRRHRRRREKHTETLLQEGPYPRTRYAGRRIEEEGGYEGGAPIILG